MHLNAHFSAVHYYIKYRKKRTNKEEYHQNPYFQFKSDYKENYASNGNAVCYH